MRVTRRPIIAAVLSSALALTACALGIAPFEIYGRAGLRRWTDAADRNRSHPDTRPGAEGEWIQPDGDFENVVRNNSAGFHDVERSPTKTTLRRTIFVGDSFVQASEVPREHIFFNLLDAKARKEHRDLEVMGAGKGGFGPMGYFLLYKSRLRAFQADAIAVILYMGNDVENDHYEFSNLRGSLPQFAFDASGDVVEFRAVHAGVTKRPDPEIERSWPWFRELLPGIAHLAEQASRTNSLAYRLLSSVRLVPRDPRRLTLSSHVDYLRKDRPSHVLAGIDVAADTLARLNHEASSAGQTLTVFLLPSAEQVYPEQFLAGLANYPETPPREYDFTWFSRALTDAIEARGVRCVDLLPEFSERARTSTEGLYWRHDRHLSLHGHEVLAEVLAPYVFAPLKPTSENAARGPRSDGGR